MNENIFKLITYNKKNAVIIGSTIDKNIDVNNDIDINETIITNLKYDKFIDEVYKMIKQIIKQIKKNKNIYFMELKAGIYEKLYITNDNILNKQYMKKFYEDKLDKSIINKDIYDIIMEIKNKNELLYFCSNLYKIRWDIKDINNGYKILFNDDKYYFKDIFNIKNVIKLDIIYFDDNEFIQYSNKFKFINNNKEINKEIKNADKIKDDIIQLINEKNTFKAIKRLYSLAKFNKNKKLQEKLQKIINTPIGIIYHIYYSLSIIEELMYKYKDKQTIDKIKKCLLYYSNESLLGKKIQNLLISSNKKTYKTLLSLIIKIQKDLKNIIYKKTNKYINKYSNMYL